MTFIPISSQRSTTPSSNIVDSILTSTTTESERDLEDVTAKVVAQVKNLVAKELEKKNQASGEQTHRDSLRKLTATLTEVTEENSNLLAEVDVLRRNHIEQLSKIEVLEAENTNLKAKNTGLKSYNSILLNTVTRDLLELTAKTQAIDLMNKLKPSSNSIDQESLRSDVEKLEATLISRQQFGKLDASSGLLKSFNHLKNKLEKVRQEQLEASKPLDQPKLERVLNELRQHLMRDQLKQVLEQLKESKSEQIQPILPRLKRDVKHIWEQLNSVNPQEVSLSQAAATASPPEERKSSSRSVEANKKS
jgi:hypothetical protein